MFRSAMASVNVPNVRAVNLEPGGRGGITDRIYEQPFHESFASLGNLFAKQNRFPAPLAT